MSVKVTSMSSYMLNHQRLAVRLMQTLAVDKFSCQRSKVDTEFGDDPV